MRKVISVFLMVAMIVGILGGCSDEKNRAVSNTNKSKYASVVNKPTKISFSFWEASTEQEQETALKYVIDEYKKVQPNVTVELLSQPFTGYQEWLKARIASNDTPTIQSNLINYVVDQSRQNILYDLKSAFASENQYANNEIWKNTFADGRLDEAHTYIYEPSFAVPYFDVGVAYYYNKGIYKKLGLSEPKTWDEFMANCQKIKDDSINPIAMMLMKVDSVIWFSTYLATGLFGNLFLADKNLNVNGDTVINDQELVRAIEMGNFDVTKGKTRVAFEKYLDYTEKYSEYCQGANGLDEAGAKAQFLSGKAAHLMSGSWDLKAFMNSDDKGIEIGAFALPRFTKENSEYAGVGMAISSLQVLAVSKNTNGDTDKQLAAVDFLKFLTASNNYKQFTEKTYTIPVMKNLDIDPSFTAFMQGDVPPLGVFVKGSTSLKVSCQSTAIAALSGEKVDREKVLPKCQEALKEYSQLKMKKLDVSEANNYGVDTIPKMKDFVPKN